VTSGHYFPQGLEEKARVVKGNFNVGTCTTAKHQESIVESQEGALVLVEKNRVPFNHVNSANMAKNQTFCS
jgi:hypothetical protein